MRHFGILLLLVAMMVTLVAEKIEPSSNPIQIAVKKDGRSVNDPEWLPQNPLIVGNLRGIYCKSAEERYVVGDNGQILQYRYGAWTLIRTDSAIQYNDVYALGDDIYAVGIRGTAGVITKYNYITDIWENVDDTVVTTGDEYYRVDATDDTLFVLGKNGANPYAITYDDTNGWQSITGTLPNGTLFRGLWAETNSEVYAAGDGGAVWKYTGTWATMTQNQSNEDLNSIAYVSSSDIHVVGANGSWVRYNGTSWAIVNMPVGTVDYNLSYVWYNEFGMYYAACQSDDGDFQTSIIKYNGTKTSRLFFDEEGSLNAIEGTGATDFYVVGDDAKIIHYGSTGWQWLHRSFADDLYGIWGVGKIAYAVGEDGCVLKYNGTQWTKMITPKNDKLYAVWGMDEKNVFAVGQGGTILKYDGNLWTEMNSTTTQALYGIWGTALNNAYAVGANGTVLKYNGTAWAQVSTSVIPAVDLYGVWGSAATNMYVVGDNYLDKDPNTNEPIRVNGIFKFNGTAWSKVDVTGGNTDFPTTKFRGVWCGSASDVYIVGDTVVDGTQNIAYNMLHSNGTGWRYNIIGYDNANNLQTDLYGVFWGTAGTGGFIAGLQKDTTDPTYKKSKLFVVNDVGENPEAIDTDHEREYITFRAIWGSARLDVFAVGENGTILHFNPEGVRHNFDRNGKADIVVRKKSGTTNVGEVHVWYMNDTSIIKDTKLGTTMAITNTYAGTGNFDGSQLNDHLWTDSGVNGKIWFHNDSTADTGTINEQSVTSSGTNIAGVGYFNHDKKSDILAVNTTELHIWCMDGTKILETLVVTAPFSFTVKGLGHFDANGITDLLVQKTADNKYWMWYMEKDEIIYQQEIATPLTTGNWEVLGIGDFDGNGLDDILWRNKTDAKLWVAFMGNGQTTPVYLALQVSPAATFTVAEIADFNGDGYDDILWKNGTALNIWKIKGQAVLAQTALAFPTSPYTYNPAEWEVVNK